MAQDTALLRYLLKWARTTPPRTYATWNPSDKSANITLSWGDLTATNTVSNRRSVRSTLGKSSGKRYREVTNSTSLDPYWVRWVWKSTASLTNFVWIDVNWWGWYNDWWSTLRYNNNSPIAYWALSSSWDVIGFALDMTAWTLEAYKNNVSQWVMYTWLSGTLYPMISLYWTSPTMTANFWATTMTYTAPTWYNQWFYS